LRIAAVGEWVNVGRRRLVWQERARPCDLIPRKWRRVTTLEVLGRYGWGGGL
jgi:hypothetical protein